MAESLPNDAAIQRFRVYTVQRMLDVRVAAMAIQREDLFPAVAPEIRCNLSTIILELGTNIVKYAGSGRILLRSLLARGGAGIEILAMDEGPGIPDPARALEDHFSTGKSLGLGLGAVQRLSHTFELTCPDQGGTRVRALCWWDDQQGAPTQAMPALVRTPASRPPDTAKRPTTSSSEPLLQLTSVTRNRPALHEAQSGDALVLHDHGSIGIRIVLDGAGHGAVAHDLSARAAEASREHLTGVLATFPLEEEQAPRLSERDIDALMQSTADAVHKRIRGSRGVAFGMAVFDRRRHRLHFLGIGNTRILLLRWKGWEGISRDGQVGVQYRRPMINHFTIQSGDVVVQSSDGIRTSTLRSMRPNSSGAVLELEPVADRLLQRTSFADDASILLTRCHS